MDDTEETRTDKLTEREPSALHNKEAPNVPAKRPAKQELSLGHTQSRQRHRKATVL